MGSGHEIRLFIKTEGLLYYRKGGFLKKKKPPLSVDERIKDQFQGHPGSCPEEYFCRFYLNRCQESRAKD